MVEGWQPTHNIKLAACFGALGVPVRTDVCHDERTGGVLTTFFLGMTGALPGRRYETDRLLEEWKNGELEKKEPMHPFLQGLRAEHNYDALLDAQKQGRRIRLAAVSGGYATVYADGEEKEEMKRAAHLVQLRDLSLVAALGTLGIPMVRIDGPSGGHLYTLPAEGHCLRQWNVEGGLVRYSTAEIMKRAEPGVSLDLLLERTDPNHPLVAAYNARHVHSCLKKHLNQTGKLVLLRKPFSIRSAYISENPKGRVLDWVRRKFQVPEEGTN